MKVAAEFSRFVREKIDEKSNESNKISILTDTPHTPMIVTGHNDLRIRFWTDQVCKIFGSYFFVENKNPIAIQKGVYVHEIHSSVANGGAVCTTLCTDTDGNLLYAGDLYGYVTVWSIREFVETFFDESQSQKSKAKAKNSINMVVCWRAHTSRITSMVYVQSNETLITASVDESVR
jgi:hypothetical protein